MVVKGKGLRVVGVPHNGRRGVFATFFCSLLRGFWVEQRFSVCVRTRVVPKRDLLIPPPYPTLTRGANVCRRHWRLDPGGAYHHWLRPTERFSRALFSAALSLLPSSPALAAEVADLCEQAFSAVCYANSGWGVNDGGNSSWILSTSSAW